MPWSNDVVKRVLPNGLTLLVRHDASAPVVAAVTHVKAGYFDEPDRWNGIAHVLEHMFFKGTARRGPGDVARETQLVGGYVNAATSYDKTVYYTVLPSADGGLEKALDVQADALMHAALDQTELGRELEVIIQEAKRKLDSPGAVTTETLYALLFQVHRMRRWRIGTEDVLRGLTAADVREYHETRYTPDRVIVGIVGDVDTEQVLDLAEAMYGGWSRPVAGIEASPTEPDEALSRVKVLRGDLKRPIASIGWRTVGTLHEDAPALDVAMTILGSGRGSRLYRALRVPGIVASAHARHFTPTEVGVFEIELEADAARIDEAVERAWGLMRGMTHERPTVEEMERAHALLETSWARRNESMDGRAGALCMAEALGGFELVDALYERMLAVTADDVRRVMQHYASPDRVSAVLYLPDGAGTRWESDWPPPPVAAGEARHADATPLPAPAGAARRRAEGERRDRPGGIVQWTFPDVDVVLRPKFGSGSVTVLLQFPGVPSRETARDAGISRLLARSVLRGAGGMDVEQLAQESELLGGAVAPHVGSESLGWGMTVRPAAVHRAAEILRAVALEARLADADVGLEREVQASDARRVRDDMFRHPLQGVLGQAFPDDAYGLPGLGDPDTLLALSAEDVRRWADRVASTRPVVVLAGDLVADQAIEALAPLTGWEVRTGDTEAEPATPTWQAGRDSETRQKEQTAFAMAFPCSAYGSDDRHPLSVVGSVLTGLAGRLFAELREKRGLAYTVAAVPWLARRAGAMLCYIATSPEREAEAREAMLGELVRLTAEPPTSAELERARNYAAGTVEIRQQSGRAVAGEILEAFVHGSLGDLAETPQRLRGVTLEDVLRVAGEVFDPDVRAEYVVRGAAAC
jgi:zinc protease